MLFHSLSPALIVFFLSFYLRTEVRQFIRMQRSLILGRWSASFNLLLLHSQLPASPSPDQGEECWGWVEEGTLGRGLSFSRTETELERWLPHQDKERSAWRILSKHCSEGTSDISLENVWFIGPHEAKQELDLPWPLEQGVRTYLSRMWKHSFISCNWQSSGL